MSKLKKKYRTAGSRSKRRCWYCGINVLESEPSIDHVVPRCRGGQTTPDNIVLSCKPCNQAKGSLDLEAYRWLLQYDKPAGERVIFFGELHAEQCRILDDRERHAALTFTIGEVAALKAVEGQKQNAETD